MKTIFLTAVCLATFSALAQMPGGSTPPNQGPAATDLSKLTADILKSRLEDSGAFQVTLHLMLNGEPFINHIKDIFQKNYEERYHLPHEHNVYQDYGYEDVVIDLNTDAKTITYQAKHRLGRDQLRPLTIDFSNEPEIEALTNLLMAYLTRESCEEQAFRMIMQSNYSKSPSVEKWA